jgi:hypothetical protein
MAELSEPYGTVLSVDSNNVAMIDLTAAERPDRLAI